MNHPIFVDTGSTTSRQCSHNGRLVKFHSGKKKGPAVLTHKIEEGQLKKSDRPKSFLIH